MTWKTGIIAAVVAVIVGVGLYCLSTTNSFKTQERAIAAAYDANKATLDKVSQTIEGSGLAADKYGDLVKDALKVAMSGRYGPDGSRAAMQWIKETMPNIDPSIFNKLQQVIEANYAQWSAAQISLRDRVRVYETDVDVAPSGWVAGVFGYPRAGFDIETYKTMIVTSETSDAFRTKTMKGVKGLIGKPQ